jgi:hypothetical protein
MDETIVAKIASLLDEAARTHHSVYRLSDGADDDWASWYSWWLSSHSELPDLVGGKVVTSELTWMLVGLDKEYRQRSTDEDWSRYYAEELLRHFGR